MKIGMITFHRANNLGANLQAFALNKYICDNIGECEIINFIPNNQVDNRSPLLKLLSLGKKILFSPLNVRERRFERFKKENYILSRKTYKGDRELFAAPPKYDLLISGSDQILNSTLSGNSKGYYLAFDDAAKKVSYASSFGRKDISENEKQNIKAFLSDFSALSAREQSGADIIKEHIGKDVKLVLDPVFLLGKEEWKGISAPIKTPPKYIFVYAMEVTPQIISAIKAAKQKMGLPVLVVYGGTGRGIEGSEVKNCGPQEFISYIDKAELVITNSFHGTAFSVILKKDFICVAHSSRNARLENIMQLCGNPDKLVANENVPNLFKKLVSGKEAFDSIKPYINESKNYLKENCSM